MLLAPPEWTRQAACLGATSGDFDPWTPEHDEAFQWAIARRVCAECPVRLECCLDAISRLQNVEEHSMRGGLAPRELKALAAQLSRPNRRRAAHGTRSAYVAGCRCDRCRRAHAEYEHGRRLRGPSGQPPQPRTLTQQVANHLSNEPRTARDIAGRTGVKTKAVRPVLEALSDAGTAVVAGERDGAPLWVRGFDAG